MSNRYKGAVISATPPTTTGGESGTASGAWTLEQQLQLQAAGLWPSQPPPPNIEDVFSTYLYTGTGSALTITNGINLSGKGGLVWGKNRSTDATFGQNYLSDTSRGITSYLVSNNTDQQFTPGNVLTSANTTGFSIGDSARLNNSGVTYVSWTFREQPKFFDIVTYTGNGAASRNIAHNLGSVPGCYIVKETNYSGTNWLVYHQSLGNTKEVYLNTTDASTTTNSWANTTPTSAVFTVNFSGGAGPNGSGSQYVAYLFAHDAGGFGLTETDNVISCGSFVTGSGGKMTAPVNLGYEVQWLLVKNSGSSENWQIYDTMRGMSNTGYSVLYPNLTSAEYSGASAIAPNATGFDTPNASGPFASFANYIYVAIRRGPMAVPTVGTSVFAPVTYTGDNSNTRVITTGFPPDMVWTGAPVDGGRRVGDRLRGLFTNPGPVNYTYATGEESLASYSLPQMSGWQTGNGTIRYENSTAVNYVLHAFKRAPSFFDVVCYTGTGSLTTITHNLAAVPELIIVKRRSASNSWYIYNSTIGAANALFLNAVNASTADNAAWNSTSPTNTVFTVNTESAVNFSGQTYVAYLFATCAGVSKVGTYTGTGAAQTINCGFTAGSRFVLIKRTDSTGDWYLWDSARGIIPSNDPYLLLNSFAAEVTGTDYVDTTNVGFDITSTAPAGINANGGTYIFLAIA